MAAQLGCPACCGHTGCTGTHNDHVKVLGLVRVMSPSSTTEDSTSSVVRPSGTTVSALLASVGATATPWPG